MQQGQDTFEFYVSQRPGVDTFLNEMSKRYELVVHTSGSQAISKPVIDLIDKEGFIHHKIYNQSSAELAYNLNNRILGRDEKDIIVLDTLIEDLSLYQGRALPVEPWLGDESDTQLTDIMPFLNRLGVINDCNEVISGVITDDKLDLEKVELFL